MIVSSQTIFAGYSEFSGVTGDWHYPEHPEYPVHLEPAHESSLPPEDEAQDQADDGAPQEGIDQHDQHENDTRGSDGGEREASPFENGGPCAAGGRQPLPDAFGGIMCAAALKIGDPENDGMQNGETESASHDFHQHVLH